MCDSLVCMCGMGDRHVCVNVGLVHVCMNVGVSEFSVSLTDDPLMGAQRDQSDASFTSSKPSSADTN